MLSTHSGKLERWLGKEDVESISASMKDWYGPPILVSGAGVWAMKGGDFRGPIQAGQFCSFKDFAFSRIKSALRRAAKRQELQFNAGFTSLSDMILEATAGKKRSRHFFKSSVAGVANGTNSFWGLSGQPAAGANAANAPGGESPADDTTGAFLLDSVSPDTRHLINVYFAGDTDGPATFLLYDRLFQVNKTMNSTGTEAVSGVPTRYQSLTSSDADYVGGNFLFVEVGGTQLAATAHNWTVCTYKDETDTASTLPSLTGNSGAPVRSLDHPIQQWFAPLETGDLGIKALTQMQCSASVATGVINFVIGHPLAWITVPMALCTIFQVDKFNDYLSRVRIFDDAALTFLEVNKKSASPFTYTGTIEMLHG